MLSIYMYLVTLKLVLSLYSVEANILAIVSFMCVASWNGAQYYIDIFSENYHLQFKKLN